MQNLDIRVLCGSRPYMTKEEFLVSTPRGSIALDGAVKGGPFFDEPTLHVNFDHHDGVFRPATMSSAMQAYFAIKGGMMPVFKQAAPLVPTYINDCDQDVCLAAWLLDNHERFEGTSSFPLINRLLTLNDRLDITGGTFPMILRDDLLEHHNWIFDPYQELNRSGALADPTPEVILGGLEAVLGRLDLFFKGEGGRKPLDTRHEILHQSPFGYWIVKELGGSEARYHLCSLGMKAFLSLKAEPAPGEYIWTAGKVSPYIPFPVQELFDLYNREEKTTAWNGSDMIGGHRGWVSRLSPQRMAEITDAYLATRAP